MLFDDQYLEEIKNRIDIVELVSQYVSLQPAGRNYRALCPFHEEKTPSFLISPEKGIFHCFGCGVGGNIFTFVMKMENLTFPEAVTFLAQKCGMELPASGRSTTTRQTKERNRLFLLNETLNRYYWQYFLDSQEELSAAARSYIYERRGLKPEIAEQFGIGFSPVSGKESIAFLMGEGFSGQEVIKAGVGVVTKDGELLDRFRGRITFALHDVQGRIIGFGGRILGEGEPKYVNVSDTPIFSKGRNLYGLFASRRFIQRSHQAILVEGYMDFLTLFQEGINNCVASMGTALTRDQALLLRRYAEEVIICYDSDAAGQAATVRGMNILQEQGLTVRILPIPAPYDPDSFLRHKGREKFLEVLEEAPSLFDFQLELFVRDYGLSSLESKAKIIRSMVPFLQSIKDPVERSLKIDYLAEKLKVRESLIYSALGREKRSGEAFISASNVESGRVKAEKMLLRAMMENEFWREKISKEVEVKHFSRPEHRRIFRVFTDSQEQGSLSPSDLIDIFSGDEVLSSCVTEVMTREDLQGGLNQEIVEDLIRRLELAVVEEEIQRVQEELSREDNEERLRYYHSLLQERERLKNVD
ncbi:MAG TPA: DNA primase [Candidatus Atribacteria bacterium]|nr:DNA primase [Candidatus Atribacteria bacterium]